MLIPAIPASAGYERADSPEAGKCARAWRRTSITNGARAKETAHYCNEKLTERIESDMQNQLAEFKLGRIVLHLLCSCQDKNFSWHWRGIVREISQGALLVWPASKPALKCDATE